MNIIRSRTLYLLIRAILFIFLLMASAISYALSPISTVQGASSWTSIVDPLNSARGRLSTIGLQNGKVLAAGGTNGTAIVKTAELFDPSNNTWTPTGSMAIERMNYAQALLQDGRVFVVGGVKLNATGDGYVTLNSTELYSPAGGTWSSTATLPVNLAYTTSTTLLNGKVLIVGGTTDGSAGLAATYLYDPASGNLTSAGSMNAGRWNHTATMLSSGKVLIIGGASDNGTNPLSSIELYDPIAGTWATTGLNPMVRARHNHTATLLANGKVLVTGGLRNQSQTIINTELYDPSAGTWAASGNWTKGRINNEATILGDGKVLVTGGTDNSSIFSSVELYDPNSGPYGSWLAGTPAMSVERMFHASLSMPDYRVLVAGGTSDGTNFLATSEIYSDGKLPATITIGNLNQNYDGSPKPVTVTTAPVGKTVNLYYTGLTPTSYGPSTTAPTNTGTYNVTAVISNDATHEGIASVTLSIFNNRLNQTISVTTSAPSSAPYNNHFIVAATASSGLAVSYSSGSPTICSNTGSDFTMVSGTGTCIVRYDQAGDASYNPAPQVIENVTATKLSQSITVGTPAPGSAVYNTQFTVAATAGPSLAVAYTSSGACGNVGTLYTMTSGTGTCTVLYNQPGDNNYTAAAQVTNTVTALKASQSINVTTAAPSSAIYNTHFIVAASATSGQPVTYTRTGVCTNTGSDYLMTSGTGTCTVQYDQSGNTNYNAASQVTSDVTAAKANQSINVTTPAPASATYNTQFTVVAAATSGQPLTFTNSGVCTNSAGTYTMISGTGACWIYINQAGNANYNAADQVSDDVTAVRASQTITVGTPAPGSAVYNTQFTVAATASSSLPVAYGSAGVCTNVGTQYTMTSGTGTCTVQYNAAGDSNYNSANQVTNSVAAAKAGQTITVNSHAPGNAVFNGAFTVAASAGSGLPVAYSSGNLAVCNHNGDQFTMLSGTGNCPVQYNQVGDANYNPAPQIVETVGALKANQTITVNTNAPVSAAYNAQFTVAASANSGLAVDYSSGNPGVCDHTGAQFTMLSGSGSCLVQYNQVGNGNYNPATQIVETTTAAKLNQTINVSIHAPANATYDTQFTVAASAGSGLAVVYSSTGVCNNSGGSYTMLSGTGTCTVKINQPGNGNFNPASQVVETVDAEKAAQTITLGHLSDKIVSDPDFFVTASASSGLTVGFSVGSTDPCTVTGNSIHLTGEGSCTVTASQAGDDDFLAATPVSQTFSIFTNKLSQTITFGPLGNKTYEDPDFTVSATASSGLAVTFSVNGMDPCTVTGNTISLTGAGTCTVTASQEGSGTYQPATSVSQTFSIARCSASITLNGLTQVYDGNPKTVTVTTNAPPTAVTIHYEGTDGTIYARSTTPPTDIGRYTVTVEINNADYSGSTTATLVIETPSHYVFLPVVVR